MLQKFIKENPMQYVKLPFESLVAKNNLLPIHFVGSKFVLKPL